MKKSTILLMVVICLAFVKLSGQTLHTGIIVDAYSKNPIANVTIRFGTSNEVMQTDREGQFRFDASLSSESIALRHVNYLDTVFEVNNLENRWVFMMRPKNFEIDDVQVFSGYVSLSKERVVGAFSSIEKDVLERSVSTNILERLEGVANGLTLNRANTAYGEAQGEPEIRVRGVNTIYSSSAPLIVLDNFPFEGDINDINPNDVETVTILKDAAASSIWGTRAGNGVIVITTKQGRGAQKIDLTANVRWTGKPDLFYARTFLGAPTIMGIENERFEAGGYTLNPLVPLPDYVGMLYKRRDGVISEQEFREQRILLEDADIRKDAERYLYRNGSEQQYHLNISGGDQKYSYYVAGGMATSIGNVVGVKDRRLTFDGKTTFRLNEKVDMTSGFSLVGNKGQDNSITMSSLGTTQFGLSPYTRLRDEYGRSLGVPRDYESSYKEQAVSEGLLDWTYRPLDDLQFNDRMTEGNRSRLNFSVDYRPMNGVKLSFLYQYQKETTENERYYAPESYHVRNLVNRFTRTDGQRIIPLGGILEGGNRDRTYQYGRFQAELNKSWSDHNVGGFFGSEIRDDVTNVNPGYRLFGYDNDRVIGTTMFDFTTFYPVRPSGLSRITAMPNARYFLNDRFLSFYGNLAYDYKGKYLINATSRWDGANIFGVSTNQKGTPLWSAGVAWNIDRESFFGLDVLSMLKLRATYGYSGNVNKVVHTLPVVRYVNDNTTGLQRAIVESVGNPNLRWEKVQTTNVGMDFGLSMLGISGTVDVYWKRANDLIGYNILDPTTGIFPANGRFEIDNRTNYANMLTKGVDVELNGAVVRRGNFQWNVATIFNYTANRITEYKDLEAPFSERFFARNAPAPPLEGKSIDVMYALPWHGLDPLDGSPLIYQEGQVSKEYTAYYNNLEKEGLLDVGVTVPRYTASLRNTISFRRFDLSFVLAFKGGHVFRRSSINYSTLYNSSQGHQDYYERWMQTGDEKITSVPAMPEIGDLNLQKERLYLNSEILIEPSDHIRFQDINLAYSIPVMGGGNRIKVFCTMDNVGIIWRKTRSGIDPDYPNAMYPRTRNMAVGVKFHL